MADVLVYLNGEVVPYAEAHVPVEDRALQFGDGIYEVVRYYGGKPFRMAQHMQRLTRSAAGIDLALPPIESIVAAMNDLVTRQGLRDATVYLQITRGTQARAHGVPADLPPTVIAIARPASVARPRPTYRVITVSDDRWARCYLKTTMLLPNAIARERARKLGCDDAIFLRDGFVMEASSSNVFLVKNGRLQTPPLTNYILAGITRGAVLEVAKAIGLECGEDPISWQALYEADELFLTGTNAELIPVVQVDGRTVGTGEVGPVFRRVLEAFDEAVRRETEA